jgi:TPR repeat protein
LALALILAAAPAAAGFDDGVDLYARGNYAAAYRELRPLAEQGDPSAQVFLGAMYHLGHGVTPDLVQAYAWFDLAAATFPAGLKHKNALRNRDDVARKMTPAQLERARELARDFRLRPAARAR